MLVLEVIPSLLPVSIHPSSQASTSELFGKVQEIPQKETTPFYPRSPYGELARLGSVCFVLDKDTVGWQSKYCLWCRCTSGGRKGRGLCCLRCRCTTGGRGGRALLSTCEVFVLLHVTWLARTALVPSYFPAVGH